MTLGGIFDSGFIAKLKSPQLKFHLLLFVFALVVDMRVSWASAVEELPMGCMLDPETSSGDCALRTPPESGYKLNLPSAIVTLDRDTVIVRSGGSIRLVQGAVWIRPKKSFSVKTEFGEAQSPKAEFWVARDAQRMIIRATGSEVVEVRPRGVPTPIGVEPGFENWIGKVARSGQARVGLPVAIDLKDHLLRWGRLYEGSKKQFKTEVESFHLVWKEASRTSADFHWELFDRKLASAEEAKVRQVRARQSRQVRDRELTDLFRRKVFEE